MNYLNMIVHKMSGSGYGEIITEAGLVTSGCFKGVMSGKHYSKSLYCLKVVSEAMERLLIKRFIEEMHTIDENDEERAELMVRLINAVTEENLNLLLSNPSITAYVNEYKEFQHKVREGLLGKTGVFWISFLDDARRVFMLIYAYKVNNLHIFHKAMGDMADLFFLHMEVRISRATCRGLMPF